MTTLAENVIKSLRSMGVGRIFGIPGGPSIPYMKAMADNGIEFVLVSNEQSAAIMADVTGRLTGIPGVCHATFGPGATNLLTGVAGALLDRSPLIALTTEVKDEDLGRKVQMNVDHQALFRPVTKWTTRLTAQSVEETFAAAFRISASEVPGPVHIGLPSNLDCVEVAPFDAPHSYEREPAPLPDHALLKEAEGVIRNKRKPVLAVGLTAARLGLSGLIRDFAYKSGIPVVLTPMAKGVIPRGHPCYAGVLFHSCGELVANVYRQADLIIGFGYDPIEFNYETWMPDVPLIHIDTTPTDIAPNHEIACDITGDPTGSAAYLNSMQLPEFDWDFDQIRENNKVIDKALRPDIGTFTPSGLLSVLREVLPDDGIITGDVGAHLHLMGQLWETNEPNRFIITNGWSAMGFGLPAAIGAKLCKPDKPVVCVTGDGGFLMNCGELITARRLGISVVVVVMCDSKLSLIDVKHGWRGLPSYGTDLYSGEFFGADTFLGAPVFKVRDESGAKAALRKAFAFSGPTIIEALVDDSPYRNLITKSFK